jgi:hypothetical protein
VNEFLCARRDAHQRKIGGVEKGGHTLRDTLFALTVGRRKTQQKDVANVKVKIKQVVNRNKIGKKSNVNVTVSNQASTPPSAKIRCQTRYNSISRCRQKPLRFNDYVE